eukprot:Gb_01583 [translate_table: standard]
MAFLLVFILASFGLLWLSSLFKLLYGSMSRSKTTFLLTDEMERKKNVLLVLAHPDDESMFFVPTILYLTSLCQLDFYILCISTGNAEGKGSVRKDEMLRACSVLKVPIGNVNILDHSALQDGFDKPWNHRLLAEIIAQEITTHDIDTLITFDDYGISGHPQHRAVHYGVCTFLVESARESSRMQNKTIDAWELMSTNIIRKYSGPLDIWCSILYSAWLEKRESQCLFNKDPHVCFLAMGQHNSQWLWFRKLFVIFSSYTYFNTLRKIQF